MNRTLVAETPNKIGEAVLIKGWVNARRNMGKIVFIDLRDRSGLAQVVIAPNELDDASKELLKDLRPEFVLEIEGVVNERNVKQKNDELITGGVEILAKKV